ncbi:hypothetical protein ABL78_2078 [Leptomonas seymouri]|uniref:Uncharacterized protein n=1 Tax=Leptomonas seymouri TaxID=5684 RepID=A0A0N0P7I0_LEPSE|nr:hypothetical protein ABL78_2078 [Leptomonas seymouri]|eukprot:KPI88819.1 hypothetical protein ABL78_2078 [Leptomonas seymouri]
MPGPLRKGTRRPPSDTARLSAHRPTPPHNEGESTPDAALPGPSPAVPLSHATTAGALVSPTAQASRPVTALLHRSPGLHVALPGGGGNGGGSNKASVNTAAVDADPASHAAPLALNPVSSSTANGGGAGAGLGKGSPNTRLRQSHGLSPLSGSAAQSPVIAQVPTGPFAASQSRATPDRASALSTVGSPSITSPTVSTLPNNMSLSGLSNHLRLSEGLSCLDYHAGFRALTIGSTRQIHVVEVIPIVGHDVAAKTRYKRSQQHQQQGLAAHAAAAEPSHAHPQSPFDGEQQQTPPPPPPMGTSPFLLRNTGVFGGLIKVEGVVWYPSTEEASLAFIQPARTVTVFLDALQFKADGTYVPQQWTRSQYKGKTLNATMAAGGGSTAMAVVAYLDGGRSGMTPATSTPSMGDRSGMYTPVSTSLAGGAFFGGVPVSHGGTPHETGLPTPSSGGSQTGSAPATGSLPFVCRERRGPAAKELIELNIDITYMRVEKIVWDPHQPYTLALSSPTTHFELWQVPTEGTRVYAPQLVLRPPAHNTRSVVRDIVFSPSNPHIITVVTECGNTGQVLLYDRRQVEAMRVFDMSGPGLSAAFHPLFSDLLAVSLRKEKTKPDTRISFLQVMSGDTVSTVDFKAAAGALPYTGSSLAAPDGIPPSSSASGSVDVRSPPTLMSTSALAATLEEGASGGGGVPASACPFLVEQPYLPPIDNYSCVSRMRWRPPSLGHLAESKRHHYMAFKPSAEELWAARHFAPFPRRVENGEQEERAEDDDTNWVDILHSQLWFATAAVTTDSDLSVWDAVNGFFPVCAVKYLGTRVDSSTSNEATDFIWVNELTLVSIFKSGEVICTSFLNSHLERTMSAGKADVRASRPCQQPSPHSHRILSSGSSASLTQQLQQQPCENKACDNYTEQHRKARAEEKACLEMLPVYPQDPYADMFATYIVLPTSSIVSDLFGRSFAIRGSNATVRHQYSVMMRREFGRLLRRLAIQISREAVLRQKWLEMRYKFSGGAPGSPSTVSGVAALPDQRARRPRSPFTQTSGAQGRGTSSQGSDSTPPSPRRNTMIRHHSIASSFSSFSIRLAPQPNVGVGTAHDRGSGIGITSATAEHGTSGSAHSTLSPPTQAWSLDDVSDVLLLLQASQRGVCADTSGVIEDGDGGAQSQRSRSGVGGRTGSAEPAVDSGDGLGGGGGGAVSCREEREHDDDDADAVETAASPFRTRDEPVGAGRGGGVGATAWIARILGFARHERIQKYRASVHEARAVSAVPPAASFPAEAVDAYESEETGASVVSAEEDMELAIRSSPTAALPARRRQTSAPAAFAGARRRPTSPISVSPVENHERRVGSPQLHGAAATGSPLQSLDSGNYESGAPSRFPTRAKPSASHFSQPRTASVGPRPGTSASSPSPLLPAQFREVAPLFSASVQGGVLYRPVGGSTHLSSPAMAAPLIPSTSTVGPGSFKLRLSGLVFTQVFPLLNEYVNVGGGRRARDGWTSRSSSAPPQGSSPHRLHRGAADSASTVTLSSVAKASAMTAERSSRKPTLLLSHLSQPAIVAPHSAAPNTAALLQQLPLKVQKCGVPRCADASAVFAATKQASALKSDPTPATPITARAYLDRQRDLTAVVECFALSDTACGWSYPERQREELAFVRFALEWDMGYELALTMKALRHDRADAETAAEAALAEDTAYIDEVQGPKMGNANTGAEGLLQQTRSTGCDNRAHQQQWHSRSCNSGQRPHHRHSSHDPLSQEKYSPSAAHASPFPTGKPLSRSDGACGSVQPSGGGADNNERPKPLLDWGSGAPTPSHTDVDDKVAAMMEENARICERVIRQQRRSGRDPSISANGVAAADVDNGVATMSSVRHEHHHGSGSADSAEARSLLTNDDEGSMHTADPRAQWWRAAAHAWRSHHISVILTITMQQLEYAAVMGDAQYCLVLYVLFSLWWRLHYEVAEAAYKKALASLHRAQRGFDKGDTTASAAYGQPFAPLHGRDSVAVVCGVSSQGWTGSTDGQRKEPQHYPPQSASHAARVKEVSTAGNRRRRMLPVPSTTSIDGSCHNEASGIPYRLLSYGLAEASESEPEDVAERRGPHRWEGDNGKWDAPTSPERLEQLSQLSLFFQRCPLIPMQPDTRQPHSASTTAATTNMAVPSPIHGGGDTTARGPNSGPLGTAARCNRGPPFSACGGFGGSVRVSTSNQRLPPRSQNSSSHRLSDPSAMPAMADGARGQGRTRVSTGNVSTFAGSYRPSMPTGQAGRGASDTTKAIKTSEKHSKRIIAARANDSRWVLVDVEGLLGVRLYAQSAEDLCASADYCTPEEWKLRALQWLEAYTADLYARQLYVPLNELLLVMPEIFREPTNPVQPRAADVAYEKQMTYVYCGNCSKAELWSHTQQERVPAAVRLYERVLRNGHHSSGNSAEDEEDYESHDGKCNGDGDESCDERRGESERWRHRHHHCQSHHHRSNNSRAEKMGSEGGRPHSRKLQRRRRYHITRPMAVRHDSSRLRGSDMERSGDDSSRARTPSVESPTTSSDSDESGGDRLLATHERDRYASFMSSDVSLSSECSPCGDADLAAELFDPAVVGTSGSRLDVASSPASTEGGSRASGQVMQLAPTAQQLAPQQQQQELQHLRIRHVHTRHARRSLEDEHLSDGIEEIGWGEDDLIGDAEVCGATNAIATHGHPRRHTAIGCGKAALMANNAACRRCHNRTAMTCVICEEVVEGMFFWLRSCGHGGHVHHVEEWLRHSQECPKCGTPITATWKGS